jgi:hypothetical protein
VADNYIAKARKQAQFFVIGCPLSPDRYGTLVEVIGLVVEGRDSYAACPFQDPVASGQS